MKIYCFEFKGRERLETGQDSLGTCVILAKDFAGADKQYRAFMRQKGLGELTCRYFEIKTNYSHVAVFHDGTEEFFK